ncbi:hypothetical protein ACHWQZ_G004116 [Mnemiopsis leidyi]
MWAELHCKLEAVAATVPAASVYLDNRPVKLPWSSTALKRMRKNKDRAWAEFDIDPSDINFSNAMSKQHTFEEEEFKAKVSYEKKITSDLKHNNKAFYAYLRNRRQVKSSVVSLDRGDGSRTDTSAGAAEVLATAFSSVFAREPPGPLPKSVNFEENECVIDDMEVRSSDVKKQLLKLNIFKSSGPDGVHPKLLKSLAYDDSFVEAVTQLFVKCSETGTLPEVWKSASVVALFKKGTKSDPLNYRPVSLTCILCKVYEKLVREHLLDFLEGRISKHQHGFVKGKSCLSNLLETFDNILNLLDEGVPVDLLFFDFSKAFDTVPHFRLLSKLEGFGIKGKVLEIIKDFLTERTMRVCVEGQWSEVKHVLSGVPQGSVLGPLLFILYVNDLPDIVKNKIKLFADDLKLICNANDNRSIADDILELEIWESIWGLKFNPSKCKVVHVNFNNNPNVKYSLNGVELEVSAQEKDLGVITHSSLLWNEQIKTSVSKANQMICWVVRNLINREKNVMLAIYKALIRPHLEYCVQLWNPVAAHGNWATVLELESVQRRFTRLIDEVGTLPYSRRLEILNLTTLAERRIRGDLIEAFKATSGLTDYGSEDNITALQSNPCLWWFCAACVYDKVASTPEQSDEISAAVALPQQVPRLRQPSEISQISQVTQCSSPEVLVLYPSNGPATNSSTMHKVKKYVENTLKTSQTEFVKCYDDTKKITIGFCNTDLREEASALISSERTLESFGYQSKNSNKLLPKITIEGVSCEVLSDIDYEGAGGDPGRIRDLEKHQIIMKIVEKNPAIKQLCDKGHTFTVVYLKKVKRGKMEREELTIGLKVSPLVHNTIFTHQNSTLYLGNRRYQVKNRFFIKQCYHCQLIGHTSADCPKVKDNKFPVCLYCAGKHRSSECMNKANKGTHQCARCKESTYRSDAESAKTHNAGSPDCPMMVREINRMASNTDFTSKNVM